MAIHSTLTLKHPSRRPACASYVIEYVFGTKIFPHKKGTNYFVYFICDCIQYVKKKKK